MPAFCWMGLSVHLQVCVRALGVFKGRQQCCTHVVVFFQTGLNGSGGSSVAGRLEGGRFALASFVT